MEINLDEKFRLNARTYLEYFSLRTYNKFLFRSEKMSNHFSLFTFYFSFESWMQKNKIHPKLYFDL